MPLVTAQERVGTTLARKYRLDRILGEGGMGVVYAGHHVRLDRKVAVKFLHPQYAQDASVVARFLSEAQAAARMQHPNVVDVYDVDHADDDGSVYMVLEYLEGEALSALLQRRGRLDRGEAIALISPVLDALARAHEQGIIHRDLKPDNIFLMKDRDGSIVPKVLDFGIAKLQGTTSATSTGQIVGTPAYMAPEQAMGRKEIGPWTDVWSMGVVLYEMLTGRFPFDFTPEMPLTAMLVTVVSTPAHPLIRHWPGAPPHIAQSVDRALAKETGDRWQSMNAFRAALEGAPIAFHPTGFADNTGSMRLSAPVTPTAEPATALAEAQRTTPFGWASPNETLVPGISKSSRLPVLLGVGALVSLVAAGVIAFVVNGSGGASVSSAGAPPIAMPVTPPLATAPLLPDAGTAALPAASSVPQGVETPDQVEADVAGVARVTKRSSRAERRPVVAGTQSAAPSTAPTPPASTATPVQVPEPSNTRRDPQPVRWGTTLDPSDQ